MEYVYFVIVLALIEYMVLGGIVGHARGKHGVRAPDCVGPDDFNRKFRVHQNTLEALVIFLPAIWICGRYLSPTIAAVLGLVWIVRLASPNATPAGQASASSFTCPLPPGWCAAISTSNTFRARAR